MKNFYDFIKDGILVRHKGELVDMVDLYREFCDDCYGDGDKLEVEYQGSPLIIESLHQEGGEGEGDDWFIVFSVTFMGETTNFGLNGWYASYNGHEFHSYEPYEVEYKEVCTMKWVKK